MRRATELVKRVIFRAGLFAELLMTSATVSSASVMAQEDEVERVVFVLHDQSPAANVARVLENIQLQLGELEVDIAAIHLMRPESLAEQARQAKQVAERQRAKAVFWFTARSESSLSVYALHAPSGRVFARDVSLAANETVQREQLAIVLRAAVPAVLHGAPDIEPLLVVSPDPPAVADSRTDAGPTPEPSRVIEMTWLQPRPPRLRIAAGYFGSKIAAAASWQSGVSAELVMDAGEWFRASLGAGYAAPITLHAEGADALVARIPLVARVGVGYSFERTALGLEAGALAEAWRRRTVVRNDAFAPTEPTTLWRFGATLSGRLEVSLIGDMGVYLLGEAQWLPTPHELELRSAGTEQQLATYALRAHLGLGATFRLPWVTNTNADDGRQAK